MRTKKWDLTEMEAEATKIVTGALVRVLRLVAMYGPHGRLQLTKYCNFCRP